MSHTAPLRSPGAYRSFMARAQRVWRRDRSTLDGRRRTVRRGEGHANAAQISPHDRVSVSDSPPDRQQAFHDVALRWLPDVTRFARSITRDETAAEDLVQETYLRAWRHWDSFKEGSEARAWLFTIARNAWRKSAPRAARLVPVEDDALQALSDAEWPMTAPAEIAQALSRADLGPAIHQAIATLPESFREVVELVELQELSYAEAADVLDIPIGTVRSRLFRARRLLQEALIEHARDAGLVPSASAPEES